MKKNVLIGISFLIFLFIFLPTVNADSGQLYKIDSETLELRDAPDQNATVLAELKSGSTVTVFEESYGWGRTFYNGKEAWVAFNQLVAVNNTQAEQVDAEQQIQTDESSVIDSESSESVESTKLYVVKEPGVRLRNAPDKNATIITELNKGAEVTILQESYGWGKTFYNESEVWIALYLLDEKDERQQLTEETEKEESKTKPAQKDGNEELEEKLNEKDESEADPVQKDEDEKLGEELNEKAESAVETRDKKESQDVQRKQGSEKTLSGYHFVIDPGHGGKDPGAVRSEIYEKTLTLSTAKKFEEQLRNKGASVTLTRADDTFIPLEERVQISNSTNTDAFISLHYNTFEDQSVRGIHTFYYNEDENHKLADTIQKSLITHVNLSDRGAKQADYEVLRDNKQPALLIELGFISNPEERKLVQTDRYQEKAAKGIAAGLENYFNKDLGFAP